MPRKTSAETKKKATPITQAEQPTTDRERWAHRLSLKDLSDDERVHLAVCQSLYRNQGGCTTPFEEFFCKDLVGAVAWGRVPTPAEVAEDLKEFADSFEMTETRVARFIQNYPAFATIQLRQARALVPFEERMVNAEVTSDAA